jgi:hypothetical protein
MATLPELKQDQLSLVRKYPLETLVTFMLVAIISIVSFVFKLSSKVDTINEKMTHYLLEDRKEMITIIERNTEAINKINYNK